MNKQVFTYTKDATDIFENVIRDENLMLNHVIIEPGKHFPKHPTDALVYIMIIRGELSIQLEDDEKEVFGVGYAIHIDKGVESTLSNESKEKVELFVVKLQPKA